MRENEIQFTGQSVSVKASESLPLNPLYGTTLNGSYGLELEYDLRQRKGLFAVHASSRMDWLQKSAHFTGDPSLKANFSLESGMEGRFKAGLSKDWFGIDAGFELNSLMINIGTEKNINTTVVIPVYEFDPMHKRFVLNPSGDYFLKATGECRLPLSATLDANAFIGGPSLGASVTLGGKVDADASGKRQIQTRLGGKIKVGDFGFGLSTNIDVGEPECIIYSDTKVTTAEKSSFDLPEVISHTLFLTKQTVAPNISEIVQHFFPDKVEQQKAIQTIQKVVRGLTADLPSNAHSPDFDRNLQEKINRLQENHQLSDTQTALIAYAIKPEVDKLKQQQKSSKKLSTLKQGQFAAKNSSAQGKPNADYRDEELKTITERFETNVRNGFKETNQEIAASSLSNYLGEKIKQGADGLEAIKKMDQQQGKKWWEKTEEEVKALQQNGTTILAAGQFAGHIASLCGNRELANWCNVTGSTMSSIVFGVAQMATNWWAGALSIGSSILNYVGWLMNGGEDPTTKAFEQLNKNLAHVHQDMIRGFNGIALAINDLGNALQDHHRIISSQINQLQQVVIQGFNQLAQMLDQQHRQTMKALSIIAEQNQAIHQDVIHLRQEVYELKKDLFRVSEILFDGLQKVYRSLALQQVEQSQKMYLLQTLQSITDKNFQLEIRQFQRQQQMNHQFGFALEIARAYDHARRKYEKALSKLSIENPSLIWELLFKTVLTGAQDELPKDPIAQAAWLQFALEKDPFLASNYLRLFLKTLLLNDQSKILQQKLSNLSVWSEHISQQVEKIIQQPESVSNWLNTGFDHLNFLHWLMQPKMLEKFIQDYAGQLKTAQVFYEKNYQKALEQLKMSQAQLGLKIKENAMLELKQFLEKDPSREKLILPWIKWAAEIQPVPLTLNGNDELMNDEADPLIGIPHSVMMELEGKEFFPLPLSLLKRIPKAAFEIELWLNLLKLDQLQTLAGAIVSSCYFDATTQKAIISIDLIGLGNERILLLQANINQHLVDATQLKDYLKQHWHELDSLLIDIKLNNDAKLLPLQSLLTSAWYAKQNTMIKLPDEGRLQLNNSALRLKLIMQLCFADFLQKGEWLLSHPEALKASQYLLPEQQMGLQLLNDMEILLLDAGQLDHFEQAAESFGWQMDLKIQEKILLAENFAAYLTNSIEQKKLYLSNKMLYQLLETTDRLLNTHALNRQDFYLERYQLLPSDRMLAFQIALMRDLENHDAEKALSFLKDLANTGGAPLKHYYYRGLLYAKLKQYELAIGDFEYVASYQQCQYQQYSSVTILQQDTNSNHSTLKEAFSFEYAGTLQNLAETYLAYGQVATAILHYRKALTLIIAFPLDL